MKIEDASPFLQVNAVAQRVRQLIVGAPPRLETPSRRPSAIALAELRAGKIEVYDPSEAVALLSEDHADLTEEQRSANEAARARFEEMFPEEEVRPPDGEALARQPAPEAPAPADDAGPREERSG